MIHFKQLKKKWFRWLKRQRKGSFAQSNLVTLITKPIWKHERVRMAMGTPLVAAMIVGATTQMPTADTLQGWDVSQPVSSISGYQTNMSTSRTLFLPVTQLTGISQFFHTGHPGIDFRSPLGSDVVAMEDGTVEQVLEQFSGYGRHVIIKDITGETTLFAHLGLIMVEPGDKVKAGEKIGEIGMTGWTTGPHLHFEVRENSAQVNPMIYLSNAIKTYAGSSKIQAANISK